MKHVHSEGECPSLLINQTQETSSPRLLGMRKLLTSQTRVTILDELLPLSIEIAKRNLIGIYNFTNPDVVSPNEILEMYREYNEEQAKVIVAPRSNNDLDAAKLKTEFPKMLSIQESLIKFVFEPNKKTEVKV